MNASQCPADGERSREDGHDIDDWLKAERELRDAPKSSVREHGVDREYVP